MIDNVKVSGIIIYHHAFFYSFIKQFALNQRSPAEGKGKGQQLLAQGNTLGNHRRAPLALFYSN